MIFLKAHFSRPSKYPPSSSQKARSQESRPQAHTRPATPPAPPPRTQFSSSAGVGGVLHSRELGAPHLPAVPRFRSSDPKLPLGAPGQGSLSTPGGPGARDMPPGFTSRLKSHTAQQVCGDLRREGPPSLSCLPSLPLATHTTARYKLRFSIWEVEASSSSAQRRYASR